jgi:HTH-type transcriptional regulator, sugar sensing transcriptional regulator
LLPVLLTNMQLYQSLEQSGMSPKQARVYVACLELGSATAQQIAKRSEVSRSTAYFVLDELSKMGLATFFDKGKIRHFSAEDPQKLFDQTKKRMNTMESAFPELQRLWGQQRSKTTVRFFEGLGKIKEMYDEFLQLGFKEYWVVGSVEHWMRIDKEWFADYMKRRASAGIRIKLLTEDSPAAQWQKEIEDSADGGSLKIMPKKFTDLKPFTSDITILPDRVAFQNYTREMTSTLLYSKETADLLRIWFSTTWEMIK